MASAAVASAQISGVPACAGGATAAASSAAATRRKADIVLAFLVSPPTLWRRPHAARAPENAFPASAHSLVECAERHCRAHDFQIGRAAFREVVVWYVTVSGVALSL